MDLPARPMRGWNSSRADLQGYPHCTAGAGGCQSRMAGQFQASYTLDGQGTLLAQTRGGATRYALPDEPA